MLFRSHHPPRRRRASLVAERFGLRCRQAARQRILVVPVGSVEPRLSSDVAGLLGGFFLLRHGTLRTHGCRTRVAFTRSFLNVAPGSVPNSSPPQASPISRKKPALVELSLSILTRKGAPRPPPVHDARQRAASRRRDVTTSRSVRPMQGSAVDFQVATPSSRRPPWRRPASRTTFARRIESAHDSLADLRLPTLNCTPCAHSPCSDRPPP